MTIQAFTVEGLFGGFIAGGLEGTACEVRVVLINPVGGAIVPNQSNVEYALWPTSQLGSLGAPALKANNGTTNSLGEFVREVTGTFFPNDEVLVALRQAAGAAGGDDDNWSFGSHTVSTI